ncbi:MAG: ribosomal L7Ae/L30e/S12e/Gadd45 family protein [Clostridia bacterium]|nr:ribosomal L7Ae/L30e/S12e/Gadd45 family protein [Clostridia bacterium]
MKKNTLGVIGLAARARGIVIGTNNVLEAVRGRKAKLVLVASDVSDNTKKSLFDKTKYYSVDIEQIDITAEELGRAVGHSNTAAVAFTDASFIKAYEKSLSSENRSDQKRGM